jgi:hypothetical protein
MMRSKARLSEPRGLRETEGGNTEHRQAVDVLELDGRPDDLEQAGQDADPTPAPWLHG